MKTTRLLGFLLYCCLAIPGLCSELERAEYGFRPTWGVDFKFAQKQTRIPFRILIDRNKLTFLLLSRGKSDAFWMLNTSGLEFSLPHGKSGFIRNAAVRPHRWIPILANADPELIVEVAILEYSAELADLVVNGIVKCRLVTEAFSPNDTGTKLVNSGVLRSAPFEIVMKDAKVLEARVPLEIMDTPEFGLRGWHEFRNKNVRIVGDENAKPE